MEEINLFQNENSEEFVEQEIERFLQTTEAPTSSSPTRNPTESPTTRSPTTSPSNSPIINPTKNPTLSPTILNSPSSSSEEDSSVLLYLGLVGVLMFLGVAGYFIYSTFMGKKKIQDNTGGEDLANGPKNVGTQSTQVFRPENPLHSYDPANRDSMSTVFSTQTQMSITSQDNPDKIDAEEGMDNALMGLLREKREEHNKKRGKQKKPSVEVKLGVAQEKTMTEMDASTVNEESEV